MSSHVEGNTFTAVVAARKSVQMEELDITEIDVKEVMEVIKIEGPNGVIDVPVEYFD